MLMLMVTVTKRIEDGLRNVSSLLFPPMKFYYAVCVLIITNLYNIYAVWKLETH